MATVHIVDDTASFRRAFHSALKNSWSAQCTEKPQVSEWELVWELTKALEAKAVEPKPADIVVTDLYPAGYWPKVKRLGPTSVPEPSKEYPGDPTSMYRAALDVRRRFLPVLANHGLHVIVLTYVPKFIEDTPPSESPLSQAELKDVAERIRNFLCDEDRQLIEKINRKVNDPENLTPAVTAVNKLLWGSST
jgi:hypothetical protein